MPFITNINIYLIWSIIFIIPCIFWGYTYLTFIIPYLSVWVLLFISCNSIFTDKFDVIRTLLANRPKYHRYTWLALIYPSIWGLYFSLSRYIRIGETYNITSHFSWVSIELIFLILLALPNLFIWFKLSLDFVRELRETFWSITAFKLYYYHLILLQFDTYFYIAEKLYKFYFLLFDIFVDGCGATFCNRKKDAPIMLKLTRNLYYFPWILTLCFISFIFLELILTLGNLHYSIYLLFIYPLFMGILRCFTAFGYSDFVNDVCMSDYVYHRYVYSEPRYFKAFCTRLGNPEYYYGFKETTIDAELITKILSPNKMKPQNYRGSLFFRIHGMRLTKNKNTTSGYPSQIIIFGKPKRFPIRLAGTYYSRKHVRWFSTTRVLYSPVKELHPWVPYFIKNNPWNVLAYVNHPSANFATLQKVTKNISFPPSGKNICPY